MDASDSNTTSQHHTEKNGKAPTAPSTWVSMEDDERVDDVEGIPEPLKQMTLGGQARSDESKGGLRELLYEAMTRFYLPYLGIFLGIKWYQTQQKVSRTQKDLLKQYVGIIS